MWAGSVTEVTTSTRFRFEAPKKVVERCGVFADASGRAQYAPMTSSTQEEDLDGHVTEFLQGRGVL